MDKYRIVCEEANIQLRGAQKMEKENPSRFTSMLLAGYCNKIGLDHHALSAYFDAGVTKDEIYNAIFKTREQKEMHYPFSDAKTPDEAITINQRVNIELEEYCVDGVTPEILNTHEALFKLNIKEASIVYETIGKIYCTYTDSLDAGAIFNKNTLKTVSALKREILDGLKNSGYTIKKKQISYKQISFIVDIKYNPEKELSLLIARNDNFSVTIVDSNDISEYILDGNKFQILTTEKFSFYTLFQMLRQFREGSFLEDGEDKMVSILLSKIDTAYGNQYINPPKIETCEEEEKEAAFEILDIIADLCDEIINSKSPMFFQAIQKIISDGSKKHVISYMEKRGIDFETDMLYKESKNISILVKTQSPKYRKNEIYQLLEKAINIFDEHIKNNLMEL